MNSGGAGIGAGCAAGSSGALGANSSIGVLAIMNGNVSGMSTIRSYAASGIGTGMIAADDQTSAADAGIGILLIADGNVSGSSLAAEYWGGSGIGTGYASDINSNTAIKNLTILNGNVTGTSRAPQGYTGSGIGTGSSHAGNSGIATLTIVNGNVTGVSTGASDGATVSPSGIGTGVGNLVDAITAIGELRVLGNTTLFCDSLRASKISIADASVVLVTHGSSLLEATPDLSGTVFLTILYGTARSGAHEERLTGSPYLSIGDMTLPGQNAGWRFCISVGVCTPSIVQEIHGLFTLVPGDGLYSIVAEGPERGFLGPSEGATGFQVETGGSAFPQAYLTLITPTVSHSAISTESPSATATESRSVISIEEPSSYFTSPANHIGKPRCTIFASSWFLLFGWC
jgi:hypothetical protein